MLPSTTLHRVPTSTRPVFLRPAPSWARWDAVKQATTLLQHTHSTRCSRRTPPWLAASHCTVCITMADDRRAVNQDVFVEGTCRTPHPPPPCTVPLSFDLSLRLRVLFVPRRPCRTMSLHRVCGRPDFRWSTRATIVRKSDGTAITAIKLIKSGAESAKNALSAHTPPDCEPHFPHSLVIMTISCAAQQ